MSVVISTRNLSKIYKTGFWKTKSFCGLDRLNLEVKENEIFGYLGPNGAGKSTTLKLLMSLIYPSSGEAEVLGKSVCDVSTRNQIGFLPEHPYFYEYLTAEEFLTFVAGLFDYSASTIQSKVEYFLKLTDVFHARKTQLRKFSKGMIQRVGIAQALVNNPRVVFLDEPMSGLDPIGRREVRDLILRLKEEGRTVFFSTHILNDVETLCDRVAILNRGQLIGTGSLDELISQEVTHVEMVISGISLSMLRQLAYPGASIQQSGTTLRLELESHTPVAPVVAKIEEASGKVISINPVRQTMEDYFFKLVNEARQKTLAEGNS
jgi:ABC-2 type transport system ATP-binding protein